MPIIEGADMTTISTDRENYPDGIYKVLVKETTMDKTNKSVMVITEIVETDADQKFLGRPFTHFVNVKDNSGKLNDIGLQTIKRYLEAAYGKKSPEALKSPPDTDLLVGHTFTLVLGERADKNDSEKMWQDVKKILPA